VNPTKLYAIDNRQPVCNGTWFVVRCGILKTKLEIMIRRLFEKLKLIKPRQPHLPQTNVSGSFKEWYLEFRSEMAKSFGVNYSISIASWTFSENHKHYYDKGLTPKEAVLEYVASKNCH
jgi:hypothetical protein